MALPKIVGAEEVVVEQVEAKTYPDGFIVKLYLASPIVELNEEGRAGLKQFFQIVTRPYNTATGELYQGTDKDVSYLIDNIWTEAQRSSTIAQMMGSICQVTSWIIRERQLLAIEEPTEEQTAELATVRQQLGRVE